MEALNLETFFYALDSQHLLAVLLFCCALLMLWSQLRLRGLKSTVNIQLAQQNEQLQLILQTLQQGKELSDQSQQQFQQQLMTNYQQLAQQQSVVKSTIEQQISQLKLTLLHQHAEQGEKQTKVLNNHSEKITKILMEHQTLFNQNQLKSIDQLIDHLSKTGKLTREEQSQSLQASSEQMSLKINELTQSTDNRLKEISAQVEKRLAEGFDKTTKTFNDIVKRLALIDDAQKKITELSSNVVNLQEVLADKRSRGAFGEVQLNSLIRNVIPEQHFALQHTLSNGKVADCALFLPKPTGTVIIDSKFPLESYRKMTDNTLATSDRKLAERQFKIDIKKHVKDIHQKYLIEHETSDGAIMFIPAESVFAEIHGHHADLVEFANKQRIWLTSPTTLMAILTTARAVLKDEATREQVHIIQAHLSALAGDFSRFKVRFDNLAKHIDKAAVDVKQIHTSADKITHRFEKIEQVELTLSKDKAIASTEND
jgi:DNA recombination protein RmuC